ncbi:SFH1 Chromatin structure-remodeling complex subunit SFH1 [Candida maltosa Xu316]|uniref:Chromatin structure-remodeling complex subunit SFH1 n=1 Tax=Candida maltosa (strain Xu316) TaxID=1245528 RepID=M3IH66_CANMX|nr:hypothetical protein G210_4175 [Candida maltosa Xu316]
MASSTYEGGLTSVQGLATSFSRRLLNDSENSLLFNIAPTGRQAKRHVQQINYSEDFGDDFELDDSPANALGNKGNLENSKAHFESQKFTLAKTTPTMVNLSNENVLSQLTETPGVLIPIKILLENLNTNHKLADTFMWNINESVVSPLEFGEIVCSDLDLPISMAQQIADSISQQVEEYSYATNLQLSGNEPYNVIIDLSVNLNKHLYQDRFEWDMNQNEVTPEMFAEVVVADLGLPLEFKNAISHALHEIIIRVKKEAVEGTFNNDLHNLHLVKGIMFENGIRIFSENSIQNGNDRWEPLVETLTSSEIEKRENERVRNLRRLKRENMRRDYDELSKRRQTGRRKFDELEGSWS